MQQAAWGEERGDKQQQQQQQPGKSTEEHEPGAARCGFEFSSGRGGRGAGGFTEEEMERQIWEEKRRMLESVEIVRRQ